MTVGGLKLSPLYSFRSREVNSLRFMLAVLPGRSQIAYLRSLTSTIDPRRNKAD